MLTLIIAAAAASSAHSIPKIKFYQSPVLERYCTAVSPAKPDPKTIDEIRRRIPEFTAAWAGEGPKLLSEVVRLTRRPFQFSEAAATLHACPDMANMPMLLLIAAARYTENSGGGAESALVARSIAERKPVPYLPLKAWTCSSTPYGTS